MLRQQMIALVFAASVMVGAAAVEKTDLAADWPQWRGPTRDGIAPAGIKLLDQWPKEGPPQVWKSEYVPSLRGGGAGSPVVAEGKVFLYVCWSHPVGGGDEMRPITPEILSNWGWSTDIPDDLAKKIEEARVNPKRPNFRDYPDWVGMSTKDQDTAVAAFLKKHPEVETYIKDFTATLDPKLAEKHGDYIKRRLCPDIHGWTEPFTLSQLAKMNAESLNKGFRSYPELMKKNQRNGEEYHPWATAWEKATESMTDTLICLDAATGKTLWKKDFPATKYNPGWGLTASGTPTISNGKCYFSGVMGMYCLSTRDGALLWQVKGLTTHASPLVVNGVVVSGWPLTAWNAETGKQVWYTGDPRAGGTPVLWNSGGKNYMIANGSWGKQFYCIDLATWKIVWEIKGGDGGYTTPIIVGDTMVCGGSLGTQAYKLTPAGAELIWKNALQDGMSSPVVFEGYVYVNVSNHSAATWHCLDLKTGEKKWSQRCPFGCNVCSSPIVADGKIILPLGPAGNPRDSFQVEMLKPSPEKYIGAGMFNPEAAECASPAVAGGKLYLRLYDGVACYDLRAGAR